MQPEHPYEHRTETRPEPGEDLGEILASLDELIVEIEGAPEGNDALDARIHFGFRVTVGRSHDVASLLINEGIGWPTVKAALDDSIPPFTTSLDASLDGEEIIFVLRSVKRRRWGAMQRAKSGEEVLGWARTEPLARRLAALKSWRADIEVEIKKTNTAAEQTNGGPEPASVVPLTAESAKPSAPDLETTNPDVGGSSTSEAPDSHDDEDKDWEVLF